MYLEKILQCLTESGLDYCIQNGYQNMPESFPTDVDIFYRNASECVIDRIVSKAAACADLHIIQKVAMGYKQYVYWLTPNLPNPGFQLELDFQSELSKKGMPHYYIPDKLLDRKRLLRGFYVPDPIDEIEYTILRRTVKHNFEAKHLKVMKEAYQTNPSVVENALKMEMPLDIAIKVLDVIQSNSVDTFENHYASFLDYVRSISKWNNTLKKRASQYWYYLTKMLPLRFLRPIGMDIALLAPDGGGKSTLLKALDDYGVTSFSGVVRKYVRPGLFQNIGQYKPHAQPEKKDNPRPHERKPDGHMKSWIRFLIYLMDFTIGYALKIVPLKWKGKLVVFDRYYYDYYVDMYRYHYTLPQFVPHLFSFLIPTPDITFILYASPEVIYNRKKELTFEETERQCKAFKELASHIPHAILIDVDRDINDIVKDIIQHIIIRKTELTAPKLKH